MNNESKSPKVLSVANVPDDKLIQAEKDLKAIRSIITAEALSEEEQKQQARQYVSSVFTEALNDRQQNDNSVSNVLVPIVEQSIEKSINQQRQRFNDYLYPLVGDLVRKFARAFLRDFIEKTNELLENSLTFKSLIWRYRAWRSGIVFSRYVASQVYTYQIQQVLLIHKDTGILLNSVNIEGNEDENSDLISSMLSAISDFVNDSFTNKTSLTSDSLNLLDKRATAHTLDEIRTDEFTLYLKQGPLAMIVAAVTGNIAPVAKDKLQKTLEEIHSIYLPQLRSFNGDVSVFEQTSVDLNDCLLFEEKIKTKQSKTKQRPWFAILFFAILLSAIAYYGMLSWQTNTLVQKIEALPTNQGIIVNRITINSVKDVELIVLRDPSSIPVSDWLANPNIEKHKDWLSITEVPFASLSEVVIKTRISTLIVAFNEAHETTGFNPLEYDTVSNTISGTLYSSQSVIFNTQLTQINGIERVLPTINVNEIANQDPQQSETTISQRALTLLSNEIGQQQVTFDVASATINETQAKHLIRVVTKYKQLRVFADELGLTSSLLVLGASDNVGSVQINQTLSVARAENTAQALVELGLSRDEIMTSGLGIIEDAPPEMNIRKTIIHVILNNK